jgi:myo-inositol-1(or 4)-monophosphatase
MDKTYREAAVTASLRGGVVLLQFFRELDPSRIAEKTKNDLVTEADRASEEAIREALADRFPSHSFLGEESGLQGKDSLCWIVDPLDGTLNFVQGFHHWCVSVALWDDSEPIVACIFDPLRGDLFLAERGMGAYWLQNLDISKGIESIEKLQANCTVQRLAVSKQPGLDGAFIATGFAFQMRRNFPRYLKVLEPAFYRAKGIRRAGSAALDMAHTAAGSYDGYFEMGIKKWDMAAGLMMVREAGGLVADWEGADCWWESGNVVAGTAGVHRHLVELTQLSGTTT